MSKAVDFPTSPEDGIPFQFYDKSTPWKAEAVAYLGPDQREIMQGGAIEQQKAITQKWFQDVSIQSTTEEITPEDLGIESS